LMENTTLTSLNLIDNKIGMEGVIHIANALKTNSTLQSLNLNKNCFGFEGVCALADGVKVNRGLQYLNLTRVIQLLPSGDQVRARRDLHDMIACNTTLTFLNIGINLLGEELVCSICNGVTVSNSLRSLNLQRVIFDGDRTNDALCHLLEDNHSLTSLSLAHCRFSATVWPQLFSSLKKNTSLMDLSLRCTLNKPERIALLCDYLSSDPCLQSIDLSDNNIRTEDCPMFADVIRKNSHLTSMILDSNFVKPEGGKILIEALEDNHSLIELFHQNCYIGVEVFNRMEELFARNKTSIKSGIATFLYGVGHEDKSPISQLRDIPVIQEFISRLVLPDWHPDNIVDQEFSD